MSPELPVSVRLSHSGTVAELSRDELTESGVVLSIDGAEQSHVELDDPSFLLHDYIRRMRSIITASASPTPSPTTEPPNTSQPPDGSIAPTALKPSITSESSSKLETSLDSIGSPAHNPSMDSFLHLGAGALTLPRWIAHWQPAAQQTVVDIEPELVDFVLDHLPMSPAPENVVADASTVLTPSSPTPGSPTGALSSPAGVLAGRRFGGVVVDLFNSAAAPAELTNAQFFARMWQAVEPGGLLLVNFGDEADMRFARRLTATLLQSVKDDDAGSVGADHPTSARTLPSATPPPLAPAPQDARALLSAPADVLAAQAEGNLVFAAARAGFTEAQLAQIWAAGPHPGDVLSGPELRDWCARISA